MLKATSGPPEMQDSCCTFLSLVVRIERLRGFLALHGVFAVLVACAAKSPCRGFGGYCRCWDALETMIAGAEEPVVKLLEVWRRSSSLDELESHLRQIQEWMPRSNTEAEVAVGLIIDIIKTHPNHAGLATKGLQCLKDLSYDTKIAISHAGPCSITLHASHHSHRRSCITVLCKA